MEAETVTKHSPTQESPLAFLLCGHPYSSRYGASITALAKLNTIQYDSTLKLRIKCPSPSNDPYGLPVWCDLLYIVKILGNELGV